MRIRPEVVVTGAGGTLGHELVCWYLKNGKRVLALDRSESSLARLEKLCPDSKRLTLTLCDLTDAASLPRRVKGAQTLIHCAANKRVDIGALNPMELAFQNVLGFRNTLYFAESNKIKRLILCSTDKAAKPKSVMGASKLLLERIIRDYRGKVRMSGVRFGNILNSTGSVIPSIIDDLRCDRGVRINDLEMTRFVMTPEEAVHIVAGALVHSGRNNIFVPQLRSVKVSDLIHVVVSMYCEVRGQSMDRVNITIGKNERCENIDEALLHRDELSSIISEDTCIMIGDRVCDSTDLPEFERQYRHLLSSSHSPVSINEVEQMIDHLNIPELKI